MVLDSKASPRSLPTERGLSGFLSSSLAPSFSSSLSQSAPLSASYPSEALRPSFRFSLGISIAVCFIAPIYVSIDVLSSLPCANAAAKGKEAKRKASDQLGCVAVIRTAQARESNPPWTDGSGWGGPRGRRPAADHLLPLLSSTRPTARPLLVRPSSQPARLISTPSRALNPPSLLFLSSVLPILSLLRLPPPPPFPTNPAAALGPPRLSPVSNLSSPAYADDVAQACCLQAL